VNATSDFLFSFNFIIADDVVTTASTMIQLKENMKPDVVFTTTTAL